MVMRDKKFVLIVGAGEAGRMVVREIEAHPESSLSPVGYLDDDPRLQGKKLEGVPVLGRCGDLAAVLSSHPADEVIIAVPSAGRGFVRRMIRLCRDAGVPFKIVPGLIEIIKGPVHLEQIREVHPEDLLGRETVEFDEEAIGRYLAGKKVLVTGAGGSIGGEICRQLGRFPVAGLYLLGRGENQIFEIEQELRVSYPKLFIEAIIGDIRDARALTKIFQETRPNFVYHAAAHKHVHYMEAFPSEAVKNNILGTMNVISAAKSAGVERLVMLSTDKAVKPRGIMGATKRLAEFLLTTDRGKVSLMAVRFGNVLGSRGSVVPLFIRQIRSRRPVTVSHPEATRFFMTLKEACMLVIQASLMGRGGEVFILRMGQPIKILEIAKDLITLHGLRPEVDVPITFVGLRPGEKIHEEIVAENEEVEESRHRYILISRPHPPANLDLPALLRKLEVMAEQGDDEAIRRVLAEAIPDARLGKEAQS